MKPSVIFSESWRNTVTGTGRPLIFALITAGLLTLFLGFDVLTVSGLQHRAENFKDRGGSVRVLVADGAVSPATCDALSQVEGIETAGAFRETAAMHLAVAPNRDVLTFEMTPGAAQLLGLKDITTPGIYMADSFADRYGYSPGDRVETLSGSYRLVETYSYPEDGRSPRFASAFLTIATFPTGSECWVSSWPPSENHDTLLYTTLNSAGTSPQIGALNPTLGKDFSLPQEFSQRISRFAFPLVAVLTALVGFIAVRLRRLEIASNLQVGATRLAICMTIALETLYWLVPAALISFATLTLLVQSRLIYSAQGFFISLGLTLLASIFTGIMGALGAVTFIRGKHLLKAFRSR